MGPIFRTIAENIRSFLQKEEELLREPKKVPDAASEVFENSAAAPAHTIVDKPLPDSASPKVKQKPQLPFSSAQLKAALHKNDVPAQPVQSVTQPQQEPQPEFIEADIQAFEEAVGAMDSSVPTEVAGGVELSLDTREPLSDGFFASFEEFLMQDPSKLDPGAIEGDLVHKMRLFHERRREGKEPFVHPGDVTASLRRKMSELQVLENEWYRRYQDSKSLERSMLHLESEIEEKTRALRGLLQESRHLSLLSQEVPDEKAFVLPSGDRIRSLSGLRHAIARMDVSAFLHHVDLKHGRNDFAHWVEAGLGDQKLAGKMREKKTREELIALLAGYHG